MGNQNQIQTGEVSVELRKEGETEFGDQEEMAKLFKHGNSLFPIIISQDKGEGSIWHHIETYQGLLTTTSRNSTYYRRGIGTNGNKFHFCACSGPTTFQ